jgi:hypothetical protein
MEIVSEARPFAPLSFGSRARPRESDKAALASLKLQILYNLLL